MSEYNRETGKLTLYLTELHAFHSTADHKLDDNPPLEFYSKKLQQFGYSVSNETEDKLDVRASKDEIFGLLSGQHIYL
jgi:hypothetical protein